MIGDLRTDALHEALARAPIEDDTLLALLVLAFAGQNVSIARSGNANGYAQIGRHAARLIDEDGKLAFDRDTLRQVARAALIDVLSCRENRSDSGVVGAHRRRRYRRRYVPAEHGHGGLSVVPVAHRRSRQRVRTRRSFPPNGSRTRAQRSFGTTPRAGSCIRPRCSLPRPRRSPLGPTNTAAPKTTRSLGADALNEPDAAEDVQPAGGYAEAAE